MSISRWALPLWAATAMVSTAGTISAAPFIERFESYSVGQTVYTEGGGTGATVYQSSLAQSPLDVSGDAKGLIVGNTASDKQPRISTSVSQATPGDYRLQFDIAHIYNGGGFGSTSNQSLFMRWGANTNIGLYAVSQTANTNTAYDLKYFNGTTFVDTGSDLADDAWNRLRVEWNTTNSTTQRLYINDTLIFTGQLIYGTIANPSTLSFIQWNTNNYAFTLDNIAFDTGTGSIAIPEPASMSLGAFMGGLALLRRRGS